MRSNLALRKREHELADRRGDIDDELDIDPDLEASAIVSGGGRGYTRSDPDPDGTLMPMSRRDAEDLSRTSLKQMREFLNERKACDPTQTLSGLALTGGEILAGAAVAGFFARQLYQGGSAISPGITLGLLGLLGIGAAQYNMVGSASPDLRNGSLGVLAAGLGIWVANRATQPAQGAQAGQQGFVAQERFAAPAPAPAPSPSFAPSIADFQNLVAGGPRRAF